MTARFPWRRYSGVRRIEKRASRTADPVERLRYLRNQMDSRELPEQFGWWSVRLIKDSRRDSGRDGGGSSGLADTLGELAMNNVEQENNLPLGLDVGTSRIVVARSVDRAQQS